MIYKPHARGCGSNACNNKAVVITFLVVEQHRVMYNISITKCLNFTTYINRRYGTLAKANPGQAMVCEIILQK